MPRRETETLKQALEDLRSDKATERQQALTAIRATFDRDSAVLRFDKAGDGFAWLTLFQALFEAFAKELKACVSKTGAFPTTQNTGRGSASVRRLSEVASLIRWLTERSVHRLNTRVLKSLLTHLTHGIAHRGELLVPVALDYAKTIKSILSYAPHLHALKDILWHELVALAFNVVLRRAPKRILAGDLDPDDDEMDVEVNLSDAEANSSTESEGAHASPSKSPLKRPFQASPTQPSRRRRRSPPPERSQPVSLEQIEFMSILAILLRSPTAPILTNIDETRKDDPVFSVFPRHLLNYFSRFLRLYIGDTSLHHDYLVALSAALSPLTLNCRHAVRSFAYQCWDSLVAMWGRKDRRMKENLVVILRLLFPLLAADHLEGDASADPTDAIATLWVALDGEKTQSQNRWGAHSLSLDSLQLRLFDSDSTGISKRAFIADTFQYGWHFDEEQAISWAILELHADCAEKLYLRSESTYSSVTPSRKRVRLENPITAILSSIKSQVSQQVRTHHLQVILFFIDRHWGILHDQLRRDIIATLVPFVSFEDSSIQSWTFLCLAAIAHAECTLRSGTSEVSSTSTTGLWEPIWTHAMRRANVPTVSRAACHAAHILLIHSKPLLSSHRVLLEIESFAKDLDVQGPAYPYDSVCDFMVLCLRIANQDVRLYRMQMEEKMLSWLTESWRLSSDRRTSMPLHTVAHIHALLEGIIGSSRRVRLRCGLVLPHCAIVHAMVEETTTRVIRDFQLHFRLPPFRLRQDPSSSEFRSPVVVSTDNSAACGALPYGDSADLALPRGRERRVSAFLLKSLEEASLVLGDREDSRAFPTAETIRCFLDLAVTVLCFEASLLLNGTQSNRRVVQAACKLLSALTPLLTDHRWKAEERRLILDGLDPLTRADDDEEVAKQQWETLVPPGERTGIRTEVLKGLLSASRSSQSDTALRRDLQRFVFRSADVQDAFLALREQLREVLRLVVGQTPSDDKQARARVDDEDGFGPVRTTHSAPTISASWSAEKDPLHYRHVVDSCITALAVVPILQSSSGEPTRDRQLTELVLGNAAEGFLMLGPAYCKQIGRRTLNLTTANLEGLLDNLKNICVPYVYKHSDEARLLVVQILGTTSYLWLQPSIASDAIGQKARYYCWWIVSLLKNQRSWRVSDAIIRFLDRYLTKDPTQEIWTMPVDGEDDDEGPHTPDSKDLPAAIIPTYGKDQDIRIRLRVAAASPRLLSAGRLAGRDLMKDVYHEVRVNLSSEQDDYESILTRLLSLGNMIIADAAVRRGAYWHLIELAYYSAMYHPHLKAVLTGVIERMGIDTLAELFNCYSSQFAYSLRRECIGIFMYPPELLGYRDRRDCAEATFHAFTPTNLLAAGNLEEINNGKDLFVRHCQAIQKSPEDGMEECFADLVAYEIVFLLNHYTNDKDEGELNRELRAKMRHIKSDLAFRERLGQTADSIVISILKSLGDQDVSPNGHILKALAFQGSDGVLDTFRAITRYRHLDTFETHTPNLPFYGTGVVLRGLQWCCCLIKDADSPAVTYHVIQQLFADIESSPLVNEQYRLLNAVCLWVACHHDHFTDEALLRTLTRRAVAMLAQVDLARGAQSLLEWCFALYKTSSIIADYRLADVLIRVSSIAHDFSQSVAEVAIAQLGVDILTWAEKQADSLRRNKRLVKQVVRALAAWPRELPPYLQSASNDVELPGLTSVLTDNGVSVSKFRLVRRIHELACRGDTGEHFSISNFWRLKACIPPENYLVDSDVDAFISLLVLNRGQVDSIGSDQFSPETLRTVHRRDAEKRTGSKEFAPRVDVYVARVAIVGSLFAMLNTSSARQVYVAYKTLRTLMSVSYPEPYVGPTCPRDIRREVELLEAFSRPVAKEPGPDVRIVLAGEAMVHLAKDFHAWIPRITILFCQTLGAHDAFFLPLTSIVHSDHEFAEEVLPVLVHCLLQMEHDQSAYNNPGSMRSVLSQYFAAILAYVDAATACYRAIINVILHLRYFHPSSEPKDALAHDKWLSVDFTLLSRCAIKCGAYTTALLFLELASEHGKRQKSSASSTSEEILFEIYSHIDEPDGFYGIQTDDLRNVFVKRLRHENQWDKAFRFHGAVLESGVSVSSDHDGIVQALYAFGFNQLALNTMQNFSDSNATTESSTLAYNLGWRAETWDLPENLGNDDSGAALYLALRAVYRERSPHAVDTILRRAFVQEMNRLRDLGNENFTEIRQVVQNLMCLGQVRKWRKDDTQRELQSRHVNLANWTHFTCLDPAFEFNNIEAIMATRVSLIRSLRQKEQRGQIGDLSSPFCDALLDMEKACLLCLSERARGVFQTQIALNSVIKAQKLERSPSMKVSQEFANVLWLMKEPKLAIKSLGSLIKSLSLVDSKETEDRVQYAALLARLGSWSAEASMKKPSQIVAEYFGPAAEIIMNYDEERLSKVTSVHSHAAIFHQYAIFAERQYHAISKSPDALRWKLYVDRKKEEIRQREHQIKRTPTNIPQYATMMTEKNRAETLLNQDIQRSQDHFGQRTTFLSLAIEMYARCLAASDEHDEDSPVRLCSLWLANFDNDDSSLRFSIALDLVPSRKFVFLAHQLTARLSKSESGSPSPNQETLQRIIHRMACDHPFHALFPLYCLKIDKAALQVAGSARRQSSRHDSPAPSQVERAAAVGDVFDKLRSDPKVGQRVAAVQYVCDVSLEWAKYCIKHLYPKLPRDPIPVPDQVRIRRLKDIQVPVITAGTPVDPTSEYRDCVWISHYDTHFTVAGGVNYPKIIKCFGSDGASYKQLFKGEGEDDLRQDAVMEQVFDLVNVVLRHDGETRKRNLSVRGYKVIPLASQGGVLEFVDNTTPLGIWLRPAHPRYCPNSERYIQPFMALEKGDWRKKPQDVIKVFTQLRDQYRPVMRHYFTEKHKTPMAWFAMRLHYARSVATTSIVGHILGLGDRHTSNILIDNNTGEVVHIDLGIAFEQGKLLPQPERVPFRLTADMIDGMGISGTQGVFQRCAEETLRVLRDGSETILTVLEVFKYDPLHSWTASEFKIKRAQGGQTDETAQLTGEAFRFAIGIDMASGVADEAADRALSTVARKLDRTLSVEYTVNELITEASDPANLALMFKGWSPHH